MQKGWWDGVIYCVWGADVLVWLSSFMVSMGLGLLGVASILENGHIGFKNKIVLHCLKEVKCHHGYASGVSYLVFNFLELPISINTKWCSSLIREL